MRVRRDAVRVVLSLVVTLVGAVGLPTVAPTISTPAAGVAPAAPVPGPSVTFDLWSSSDWTVPAGITAVTFDVYGAAGGGSFYAGGRGGRATLTTQVTPGTEYVIGVGAAGWRFSPYARGAGGDTPFRGGGRGGGASYVLGPGEQPLLIAGGGGGDGADGAGGAGGGSAGQAGSYYGTPDPAWGVQPPAGESGAAWTSGSSGHGGWASDAARSGAGGGGWQGGAAGSHGGGGAGGSGYGVVGSVLETGVWAGDGRVTITYVSGRVPVTVDPGPGGITSTPAGIDCRAGSTAGCTASFDLGASVTLTASPSATQNFASWAGDCAGAATATCTIAAYPGVTASARFARPTLTVQHAELGWGTIESDTPGFGCTAYSCTFTVDRGTTVDLRPNAFYGTTFRGWSGGGCTGTGTCTVTVNDSTTVTGDFWQPVVTLHVRGTGFVVPDNIGANACNGGDPLPCLRVFPLGHVATLYVPDVTQWGTRFAGWSGDCSGEELTCTLTLTRDMDVTATFVQPAGDEVTGYSLTAGTEGDGDGYVDAAGGIDCGSGRAACEATYDPGAEVTLTAHPALGTEFSGWTAGCIGFSLTCTMTMTQARVVTASFTSLLEPLDVATTGDGEGYVDAAAGGIDCGGSRTDCSRRYEPGTDVTLTAHPAPGSRFAGWTAGCAGTDPTCSVAMDDARVVTASFDPVAQPLAVSTIGSGSGHVESSPVGIDCGAGDHPRCWWAYRYGTEVTLTATPDQGSLFAGWTGACAGAGTTCTVAAEGAQSATARFVRPTRPLTVATTGTGSGHVECAGGPCPTSYRDGATATLSAVPDQATSVFAGWTGACAGTSSTCTLTMDQTRSVTARFDLARRAVSVATVGDGSVTCAVAGVTGPCASAFDHGTRVDLLATPAAGWTLAGWSGDGCLGTGPDCLLTLDRDRAVTATFEPTPVLVTGLRLLPGVWSGHTRNARLVVDLPDGLALPTKVAISVTGAATRSRTVSMAAGRNVLRFDGAWAERTFGPGRYRVTVRAADAGGGWSAARSLHWRVRR